MGMNFVSDEIVEMRYQYKEEFVEESEGTNVVIAANATAQARLKLYSYLEQLGRKIYTHHKNLVAGQHVKIFGRFGYVFYLRHVGSLSEFSPKAIQHQFG
jgi:hypothetical protein